VKNIRSILVRHGLNSVVERLKNIYLNIHVGNEQDGKNLASKFGL